MDKAKFQYEGLKWIMEMELLNHPQAINTIKFNILMVSPSIKEVELLIYREQKSMLVLLELSWFGRKFKKKRILAEVQEALSQLLTSFRFRITDDPKIMNLAIAQVKKALTGGISNENGTSVHRNDDKPVDQSVSKPSEETSNTAEPGTQESSEADQEEQPVYPDEILTRIGESDS